MRRFMSKDLMVTVVPGGGVEASVESHCGDNSCPESNPSAASAYEASEADLEGLKAHLQAALG